MKLVSGDNDFNEYCNFLWRKECEKILRGFDCRFGNFNELRAHVKKTLHQPDLGINIIKKNGKEIINYKKG